MTTRSAAEIAFDRAARALADAEQAYDRAWLVMTTYAAEPIDCQPCDGCGRCQVHSENGGEPEGAPYRPWHADDCYATDPDALTEEEARA